MPKSGRNAESMVPVAPRPSRSSEKGAELLEFTVVVGALLALMLGIVVFARAYNIYETITRAAREGARMAVMPTAVAAAPSNSLDLINTSNACTIPPTTTNTPATAIFDNYIKPALEASNLNPNNVQNYQECVGSLDPSNPSDADAQCGVVISFQYPDQLTIPFLGAELGTVNLGTQVQMRLENQPAGSCP